MRIMYYFEIDTECMHLTVLVKHATNSINDHSLLNIKARNDSNFLVNTIYTVTIEQK